MFNGVQIGTGYWGQKLYSCFAEKTNIVGYINLGNSSIENIPRIKKVSVDADFVIIATPIKDLFFHANEALIGNKHIFLEKPGADSSFSLKTLKAANNKFSKIIFVGYKFIYDPRLQALKKTITKDSKIDLIWNKYGSFNNDIVLNLLSHDIAILLYLLEEINSINVVDRSMDFIEVLVNGSHSIKINRADKKEKYKRIFVNGVEKFDFDLDLIPYERDAFLECIKENKVPKTDIDFAINILELLEKNL